MAKKALILLIVLSLLLSVPIWAGCGGNGDDNGATDEENGTTQDDGAEADGDGELEEDDDDESDEDGTTQPDEDEADGQDTDSEDGDTTDTTAPLISEIAVTDITATDARVTWKTDEPATSQVEYGLTTSYGSSTTLSATLTKNHSVELTDLGSTYHYRVKSKDSVGNEAVSGDNTFSTTEGTTEPTGDVEIVSHSSYLDTTGSFKVVGEVRNVGSDNLSYVRLTATFYDSSNTVVGTDFTFSDIDILVPGQKSPFELFLLDDAASASVDHYVVVVSDYNVTTEQPYRDFEILSHTSSITSSGWYRVVGEVENTGSQSATWVRVDGTFYDAAGGVVACDFTFTDPDNLDAGQIAPFELTVLNETLSASIASYELQVQGSCG